MSKTILVTGSSSGIGLETALALAQQGHEIILAARTEQKLKDAVERIKTETGNNKLKYYTANFSSLKSVRALAENIKRDYTKLDVLVNNAGGVFSEFELNEDGLEMTIATNHYSYFLLTGLLLDLLKKSDEGRIVNVASRSSYRGKIDFESFTKDKGYFIMKAYGQSKLANVLFTVELAERLKGTNITANCLHPGVVKTDIGTKDTKWYASIVWTMLSRMAGISVKDGAKTSVFLATSPEVKGATGKYFDLCKAKEPNKDAYNANLRKELWSISENYAKYSYL
jgi:NAD(P)-dependent dehydrogenase (short-subunit alcohol dehydrogenase family)